MIRLLLFTLALLTTPTAGAGNLTGDADALARVDKMLEHLGGKQLWAEARSLYTMERARHPAYGDGIVAVFWRDLEKPGERAELKHDGLDIEYAFNDQDGWMMQDGEVTDMSEREHAVRLDDWSREIYTLYHQLAKGERHLTIKALDPNGFRVLDEAGEKLGDFKLTPEGELYFWQQYGSEHPVAYVYGPHKDFGNASFPDWGTSTDGNWAFYYVQVYPSTTPMEKNTSLKKPRKEWLGGALHPDNCESP